MKDTPALYGAKTERVIADDTSLMLPGSRFPKQAPHGENSITLKQEVTDARRQRAQQKALQLAHEAREISSSEQDDMYGAQES